MEKKNAAFFAEKEFDKVLSKVEPDWESIIKISDCLRADKTETSMAIAPRIIEILKNEKNAKVLDTLSKHGPEVFVQQIATVEVMQALMKILKKRWVKRKKPNPHHRPDARTNHKNLCGLWVAFMIFDWGQHAATAWGSRYPVFTQMYNLCIAQGVIFPPPTDRPAEMAAPPVKKKSAPLVQFGGSSNLQRPTSTRKDVETEINAASNAVALLRDIIANTSAKELSTNDIALDVVGQLKAHAHKLSQYATHNLDNEKLLGSILGTHDRVTNVLERFERGCNGKFDSSESDSSGEIVLKKPSTRKKSKGHKSPPPQQQQIPPPAPFAVPNPFTTNTFASNTANPFATANPFLSANPNPFASNSVQTAPFPQATSPYQPNPQPNPYQSQPFPYQQSPPSYQSNPYQPQTSNPQPFSQPYQSNPLQPIYYAPQAFPQQQQGAQHFQGKGEYVNMPHPSQAGWPPQQQNLVNPFAAFTQ